MFLPPTVVKEPWKWFSVPLMSDIGVGKENDLMPLYCAIEGELTLVSGDLYADMMIAFCLSAASSAVSSFLCLWPSNTISSPSFGSKFPSYTHGSSFM